MEWIGPAISAAALVLVAIIEAGAARDRKKIRSQNALQSGVKALLRDRIIRAHNHYMDKGYIPVYGLENVLDMYAAYHDLGGNGTITKLVEGLKKLPTDNR